MKPIVPNKAITIVLIDDDTDDHFLFGEAIAEIPLSVAVMHVCDRHEFYSFLDTDLAPDFIFLDSSIECGFSKECLDEIKKQPHLSPCKVIMYTSHSAQEMVNRFYGKGIDLFIEKPADFDELVVILRTVIRADWEHYNWRNAAQLLPDLTSTYIHYPLSL